MGIFRKKTDQKQELWNQFKGKGNSEDVLAQKAKAVGACIIYSAGKCSEDFCIGLKDEMQIDINEWLEEIFIETIFFVFHYADRVALQFLSASQREIFNDNLISAIFEELTKEHIKSDKIEDFKVHFYNQWAERQLEYGKSELQPENAYESLFHRFSRNITRVIGYYGDPKIAIFAHYIITDRATNLQLAELFEA